MAWGSSAMFQAFVQSCLEDTATGWNGLETDVLKVALYDNDITPDKDAAVASTGFNTGAWAIAGNEVTDATNWVSGGRTLAGSAVTDGGSGITQFDATDLAGGGTVTLTNAFGCLVYNDDITAGTVVDQGITYHYFGGGQTVTAGTFTIVWHANGLFRITV
jgi:hypothetical protein